MPDRKRTAWASDAIFPRLVEQLVEARAGDVERASPARRPMADVKEEERGVRRGLEGEAARSRGRFEETLRDAWDRSGGEPREISYDSADPGQDEDAALIARYLVPLEYAEMATDEKPGGREVYRVRVFWERLGKLAEPQES